MLRSSVAVTCPGLPLCGWQGAVICSKEVLGCLEVPASAFSAAGQWGGVRL